MEGALLDSSISRAERSSTAQCCFEESHGEQSQLDVPDRGNHCSRWCSTNQGEFTWNRTAKGNMAEHRSTVSISTTKFTGAVVKAVAADDLNIVGLALRADARSFDTIVNGLKLHT